MSSSFVIEVAQQNTPVSVLRLSGRLEAAGAQDLLQKAMELQEQGVSVLVLIMRDVEFLASSGLGTLLLLTEEYRDRNGQLILTDLPNAVSEVISLLNLDQFLHVEENVESSISNAIS